MEFVADFHIHSKYSRAVSKDMVLEEIDRWAGNKGLLVMGTGDFTHPQWFREIQEKLEPAEPGLFKLKEEYKLPTIRGTNAETRFILTVEISGIYSKGGRTRRIHNVVFAPDIETADKINTQLSWVGNLSSDGRPILGLDSEELAKIVFNINPEAMIVPAHCLLPDTVVHTKYDLLKPIQKIQKGDLVFTHKNRWRKVKQVFKRPYNGKIYHIKPRNFALGLATTSEHPFYVIKTHKNCYWGNSICKPAHLFSRRCRHKYFKDYKPQWVIASQLERGDVLIFPRFSGAFENHATIDLKEITDKSLLETRVIGRFIAPIGMKITPIKQQITIDKNFCKLAGYYLSEGYTNSRDLIGFAFSKSEKNYMDEVIYLMNKVFGFNKEPKLKVNRAGGVEILFFSKVLNEVFRRLFYVSGTKVFNASTKALPYWAMGLPSDLLVEIFRCWRRGDAGYTTSRLLANQMKIILLRLGIVPSIYVDKKESYNQRPNHFINGRKISARYDTYSLNRLSFFEDKFRLLEEPEFAGVAKYNKGKKYGWMDENYVYLPIYNIEIKNYKGGVYNLEVEEDNSYICEFATVHNCWTPWFSVFGSMSGFDSMEECFGKYTSQIFAIETGLSSDPQMNWRLSKLDNIAIISNSDSHSLQKIGREANIFNVELSYKGIKDAIKASIPRQSALSQRKSALVATLEFYPEEGKYHFDGHRLCGIYLSPAETKKYKNICPKCGKPLTIGVLNRVHQLADRPEDYKDSQRVPFERLIPLEEVIGEALGVGAASKSVKNLYEELIKQFGEELAVLRKADIKDLAAVNPMVAEAIKRVREGKLTIRPGYDGEYGKISIFGEEERKEISAQKSLF